VDAFGIVSVYLILFLTLYCCGG